MENNLLPDAYAVYNKDEKIRLQSSSGGVFYNIAKYVITNGGIIAGARFDANWTVEHGFGEKIEDIKQFMGSKYVQSSMKDTFKKIKSELECNRLVLFTGTPCQVNGLLCYLRKDYTNLITLDFICHGVPSRMVWREYLNIISRNGKIIDINFRNKMMGWKNYSLKIRYDNQSYYEQHHREDIYMRGFLQNLYLRPSCYECKFKGYYHRADITIGDFWGIEKILPKFCDDKGISIILLHSKLGKQLWSEISNEFRTERVSAEVLKDTNSAALKSVELSDKRKLFYGNKNENIYSLINELTKPPMYKRYLKIVKRRIKKMIKWRCKYE